MNAPEFYNSLSEQNKKFVLSDFILATYASHTAEAKLAAILPLQDLSLENIESLDVIVIDEFRGYIAENEEKLTYYYK